MYYIYNLISHLLVVDVVVVVSMVGVVGMGVAVVLEVLVVLGSGVCSPGKHVINL